MTLRAQVPSKRALAYMRTKMRGQMQSIVAVYRPLEPTFDASSGLITAHAATQKVWQGPARIYPASGGGNIPLGDGYLTQRTSVVSVMEEGSEVIRVNDLVQIVQDADDAAGTGQEFRIIDVTLGGVLDPTRKLTCTDVEPNSFHPQS